MAAISARLLVILLLGPLLVRAQDSILLKPKWQEHFAKTDNSKYGLLTFEQMDRRFQYGEYYDALLVFRDSTRVCQEVKIKYQGIANLCDMLAPLEYGAKNKWGEMAYTFAPMNKRELKGFVFADITFLWQTIRHVYKVGGTPDRWSILVLNGPIMVTRGFYISKMQSGTVLTLESDEIQKYEERLYGSISVFGGFSFKKTMSKAVQENATLVEKITAGEQGYGKTDVLKIFREYNEWVAQQDPAKYQESLVFPAIRY